MASTFAARSLAVVICVGALALAACGSTSSSGGAASSAPAPGPLGGSSWNLSSYAGSDGASVPAVTTSGTAPLTFGTDGTWFGSTGCNRMSGTYTQDGSALTLAPGPMTLMACDGPVAAQEAAIVAALPLVASFTADSSLVLLSADGTVLLTYAPGLAGLTGTSWTATGINDGNGGVVSQSGTEKATIEFGDDGQASGSGGCNRFSGTYTTTDPDGLSFGPLAATEMACPDGSTMQIEQEYFTALAAVATYQLEGDRLTLRDGSGATQVTYQQAS